MPRRRRMYLEILFLLHCQDSNVLIPGRQLEWRQLNDRAPRHKFASIRLSPYEYLGRRQPSKNSTEKARRLNAGLAKVLTVLSVVEIVPFVRFARPTQGVLFFAISISYWPILGQLAAPGSTVQKPNRLLPSFHGKNYNWRPVAPLRF
jgi:hypothetical protein